MLEKARHYCLSELVLKHEAARTALMFVMKAMGSFFKPCFEKSASLRTAQTQRMGFQNCCEYEQSKGNLPKRYLPEWLVSFLPLWWDPKGFSGRETPRLTESFSPCTLSRTSNRRMDKMPEWKTQSATVAPKFHLYISATSKIKIHLFGLNRPIRFLVMTSPYWQYAAVIVCS